MTVKLYETHSHTPLCKHAHGLPLQYAEQAYSKGLAGLIVTCHNPMPDGFSAPVRMLVEEFDQYLQIIDDALQSMQGRLEVHTGLEADFYPGYESWLEQQLSSFDFAYVLGSVHPQIPEYRKRYWTGDALDYQRTYFRLLADAAETQLFDCLSHPDLVKNETPESWNEQQILPDICRALDRIAQTGVAMEINTSGANKAIPQINPFPAMLKEMCVRDIPVVIGSDAHVPGRVADGFLEALDLAEEAGYAEITYVLHHECHLVSIRDARQAFQTTSRQVSS